MKDVIALCREDAASDVDRDEIRREADASLRDTVSALTKHLLGDDLKLEFKPISEYSEANKLGRVYFKINFLFT